MISDFLLRVDALTPSASAIAMSWALSFDSRTDCSSACAVTLTFSLWWRTARPLCAAPGERTPDVVGCGIGTEIARSRRCMHMRTIDDRSADPCVRRCQSRIGRIVTPAVGDGSFSATRGTPGLVTVSSGAGAAQRNPNMCAGPGGARPAARISRCSTPSARISARLRGRSGRVCVRSGRSNRSARWAGSCRPHTGGALDRVGELRRMGGGQRHDRDVRDRHRRARGRRACRWPCGGRSGCRCRRRRGRSRPAWRRRRSAPPGTSRR